MPTFQVKIKGAETPEGRERIQTALDARNRADFECFKLLSEMDRYGLFSKNGLLQFWGADPDSDPEEVEWMAEHFSTEVRKALRARSDTNDEFMNALAGR